MLNKIAVELYKNQGIVKLHSGIRVVVREIPKGFVIDIVNVYGDVLSSFTHYYDQE